MAQWVWHPAGYCCAARAATDWPAMVADIVSVSSHEYTHEYTHVCALFSTLASTIVYPHSMHRYHAWLYTGARLEHEAVCSRVCDRAAAAYDG